MVVNQLPRLVHPQLVERNNERRGCIPEQREDSKFSEMAFAQIGGLWISSKCLQVLV
jgi:hypothetical protein